jgi:DNA-binding NarL/FixJ family response regulator
MMMRPSFQSSLICLKTLLACDAQAVRSPTQAFVKLAIDSSIEILIADINMPGLTGYDLAEKVRQIRPDVKVLLVSGREDEDKRFPLLRKPFVRADLAQVMERITGVCWSG